LAYFAAVDFVYIARLATYVAIHESDRTPPVAVAPEPPRPTPEPTPMPTLPAVAEPGLPTPDGTTS
jgi:hypothetical protein